jgi:hypothetical protein
MASPAEERTRHFYAWERRGRGCQSYPYPVSLEPPFVPFRFLRHAAPAADDGRHHTWLSSFLERLSKRRGEDVPEPDIEEPEPESAEDGEPVELRLILPQGLSVTPSLSEGFLKSLAAVHAPLSLELVGSGGQVSVYLSARSAAAPILTSQLRAFFPAVSLEEGQELLLTAWEAGEEGVFSAVELGLSHEFMLPLERPRSLSPDPLTAIIGALAEAGPGEVAIVQVLFQGARAPWADSVARSVVTPSGDSFFADAPEITKLAREKVSAPLFAVAVRVVARAGSEERLWTLLYGTLGALSGATRGENELVPLGSGDIADIVVDVVLRTTHRSGFILSLPELMTLVHLPHPSLPGIARDTGRTKVLPEEAQGGGLFLGYNVYAGVEREARLSTEARLRHVHVVGASGTGKSTLLVSMILQDIAAGHGVGVIDPHGDLIDEVLGLMPEHRAEDVILFDPADPEYVVGWNMLSATSEAEKDMLASDLVAVFRRLATSWGDQMTAVLANAILAFLESERGGTLLDLRRFLVDQGFRKAFLATVRDDYARDFWTTEFPMLSGKPQASILTRLDTLLRGRLVRGVVTAADMPLDFRGVVDDRRIFLAKLSQGAIGEENAALLGSLLVSKLHQVCLLRQDIAESARRPFFLYLDEFHNLATPSMAALFSGARKYRLGVTVAHQDLYQLRHSVPEVERAVLGNAYTRICFRLGDEDARTLSQGFSFFEADDLGNLDTGKAVCRVGRKEHDFNLSVVPVERGDPEVLEARRRDVRKRSLSRWGTRRSEEAQTPPATAPEEPRRAETPPKVAEPHPVPAREEAAPPVKPAEPEAPRKAPASTPAEGEAPRPQAPTEPRRPGKGGPEHTYLQELIKRWGEEHGFRAVVEEAVAGGRESVDVALYRGNTRIACEVSVTTPLEYEVGNVEKCLAAGFGTVVVVSLKKARLAKLGKLLTEALPPEERGRVHLFTTEETLSWLAGQPVEEQEGMVGGYKVKVRYKAPEDARTKRVAEILARSMGGLRKDGE